MARDPVVQLRLIVERICNIVVGLFPIGEEDLPIRRLVIEKLQQVDQVSGGAEHRAALFTLAEIERPEQAFHGRVLPDERLLGGLAGHGRWRQAENRRR